MTIALIDIASDIIRLTIADRTLDNDFDIIDSAEKNLNLIVDIAQNGKISSQSIYATIKIIKDFLELLIPYQIKDENVYLIATKSINLATNKDIIIDRVKSKTGLTMQILENIEENHLNFLSFKKFAKKHFNEMSQSASLIVELGQASSEMLYLVSEKTLMPINIDIGLFTVRTYFENASLNKLSATYSMVLSHFNNMQKEIDNISGRMDYLILFGKSARDIICYRDLKKRSKKFWVIERGDFESDIKDILDYPASELSKKFSISISEAERLFYSSICYSAMVKKFTPNKIVVLNLTTGSRLLNYYLLEDRLSGLFEKQILPTLEFILNKYQVDAGYCAYIRNIAVSFFDKTIHEHRLSNKERLYLQIVSTLIEVGKFINYSKFHLHTKYIIENTSIFGLNREDMRQIGLIAKYSFEEIDINDFEYRFLDSEKQLVIQKLSSILKLALYLESTYMRKIDSFEIRTKKDQMFIALTLTGSFFATENTKALSIIEDTFGYKIIIE